MTRATRLLWATGIMAVLCFAYLAWLSRTVLTPAPGLAPFDAHLTGYTMAQARDYLAAISPHATLIYLGTFRLWDTVFPVLAAFTLGGVTWVQARGLRQWVRLIALLAPAGYLLMDLAENALVAELLLSGADATGTAILRASQFTVVKWALFGLAGGVALGAWLLAPTGAAPRKDMP
ncbi:hypothetical protein [Sulfitobacter sabulilitoris]|uniref:ABL domain-containing protein n=1 Tax=Sulfitobacter sabulilitoris TaxID=2562655 RepID=A0A5S3PP14_9RHOB|nr:hypothetical protein [Sulfitobacter sabulilitoris]TMM55330.1 hypothetical protein FDT80_07190 [Sulfitobacter sabulilitoris]